MNAAPVEKIEKLCRHCKTLLLEGDILVPGLCNRCAYVLQRWLDEKKAEELPEAA